MKRQIVYLTFGRGVSAALQACVVILFARAADVHSFGVVNAVLGIVLVLSSLGDFGVSTYLAKVRALGDFDRVHGCIRFSRATSIAVALASVVGVVLYAGAFQGSAALVLIVLAVAIEKNIDCLSSIFIADGSRWFASLSILLRRTTTLAAFAAAQLLEWEPVFAYCGAYLIGALVGQLHIIPRIARVLQNETAMNKVRLIDIARDSFPFFLSNFSAQSRFLDIPAVGLFGSAFQAGLYAAATKLASPFLLIPGVLAAVVMPHATRLNLVEACRLANKLYLATFALTAVTGILTVYSEDLTTFLLGQEFAPASLVVVFVLLGLPATALASPLGSILQSQHQEKFVGLNGSFFAILALGATILGAVIGGAALAAAMMAASYWMKTLFLVLRLERQRRRLVSS